MTDAEQALWYRLRRRQVGNHRFRRQVPIGPYVVDFCCVESRTVVEVDGSQHLESVRDVHRDDWLQAEGYLVLRFWNHDVLARADAVLTQICEALSSNRPLPPCGHLPPQAEEGKAPPKF